MLTLNHIISEPLHRRNQKKELILKCCKCIDKFTVRED